MCTVSGAGGTGVKRSTEESERLSGKRSRIAKYGLKFQSAGNLVTVGDQMHMDESGKRGRGYRESVEEVSRLSPSTISAPVRSAPVRSAPVRSDPVRSAPVRTEEDRGTIIDSGPKFSFGFSKNKRPQYHPQGSEPPEKVKEGEAPGPPPLMSRQRELMTKAFGGDSDSEGEGEGEELVKMAVRGTPRFMFQIRK